MLLNSIMMGRFRGAARLRSLARGAAPVSLGWGKTKDGLLLALDPEGYIDRFIHQNGYYEREVLAAILENLPPHGVFWDVGANIGIHILTAKLLRPDSRMVAFEPVPFTLDRLIMNARKNDLDIQTFSCALGELPGYSTIAFVLKGNAGLSSLKPWSHIEYDGQTTCRVERIDDLISSGVAPSPSVIKMDVEGFELEVLKGASQLLGEHTLKAVIFESDGVHLEALSTLLDNAGFIIKPLLSLNTAESPHATPNYLAVRASLNAA